MPKPTPVGAQVLVKVHAAGITGDEVTWQELYQQSTRVPGMELSGTIAALGPDYAGMRSVGDAVYAMLSAHHGQGQAEYALCLDEEMSAKPSSLSHAEAAALPIPAMTAWEAIYHKAEMGWGNKVLVTGASGAVGRMMVQAACRLLNAKVTALASRRHHELLRKLGAQTVLDYHDAGWETSATDFDIVLDTVGANVLHKTWDMVKSNGTIVTVGPPEPWAFMGEKPKEQETHPDVKCTYFIVSPSSTNLEKVAELIDGSCVKGLPVREFPSDQAVEAWEFAQTRNRDSKGVIVFHSGN
jgi:NADPH:quinone reductase-like Zn-dependent oxidoreductase